MMIPKPKKERKEEAHGEESTWEMRLFPMRHVASQDHVHL